MTTFTSQYLQHLCLPNRFQHGSSFEHLRLTCQTARWRARLQLRTAQPVYSGKQQYLRYMEAESSHFASSEPHRRSLQ